MTGAEKLKASPVLTDALGEVGSVIHHVRDGIYVRLRLKLRKR